MEPFELLEHTADALVRVHGADLNELFANAAMGMFTIIGEPAQVHAREECVVELEDEDLALLLRAWLDELLFRFETAGLFFGEFACDVTGLHLRGVARGEPFDAQRHGFKTEIKAVTHHMLALERAPGGWTATVLFDL